MTVQRDPQKREKLLQKRESTREHSRLTCPSSATMRQVAANLRGGFRDHRSQYRAKIRSTAGTQSSAENHVREIRRATRKFCAGIRTSAGCAFFGKVLKRELSIEKTTVPDAGQRNDANGQRNISAMKEDGYIDQICVEPEVAFLTFRRINEAPPDYMAVALEFEDGNRSNDQVSVTDPVIDPACIAPDGRIRAHNGLIGGPRTNAE